MAALNCRPGDLARIVGIDPAFGLNDKIVKLVDSPAFLLFDVPHWKIVEPIEFQLAVAAFNSKSGNHWAAGTPVVVREVPDRNLRPIRDPGSDAVDEMVQRLGAAPKTLTEVREVSHG